MKPGKGAAFVRTKIKNYITGNTVEKTFRAGSTINEANISKETKQYTYKDGSQFVFMDLVHVSNLFVIVFKNHAFLGFHLSPYLVLMIKALSSLTFLLYFLKFIKREVAYFFVKITIRPFSPST